MTDGLSITFAPMQSEDIPEVIALARRIWLKHYISIITVEQIEYMLARGYSREALEQSLKEGQMLLAKQDNAICGFLGIGLLDKVSNTLLRGEDAGEGCYFLHRCYLAPEMHGKGIGRQLFAETLKRLPDARLIRLQVNRHNIQACNFYKRQEFEVVGQGDFDIGGGFLMQDYIMQWKNQ